MVNVVSRVKFALRFGGDILDSDGPWTYFDDTIGYIEDWSGLLSEGAVAGDIIEQDWTDGAVYQKGKHKTYSFDVPYTALVPKGTIEPNIWESFSSTIFLNNFRGPQLTMRREFLDKNGTIVREDQAIGVLATDLAATVGIGRVIHNVAVFQNLTGYWREPAPKTSSLVERWSSLDTAVWSVPTGASVRHGQLAMGWGGSLARTQQLVTKNYYSMTNSSVTIDVVSISEMRNQANVLFYPLRLWNVDLTKSIGIAFKSDGDTLMYFPYTTDEGIDYTPENYWVNYDDGDKRLRIRESGGQYYFEVESNSGWFTFSERPVSMSGWNPKKVRIGALADTTLGTGVSVEKVCNLGSLNTTGSPIPKVSGFAHFFPYGTTTLDRTTWMQSGGGISILDGVCIFTWDGVAKPSQYIRSKYVFDLTNSAIYMRLPYVNSAFKPFSYHSLILWNDYENYSVNGKQISIRVNFTSGVRYIDAYSEPNAWTGSTPIPYVPATHIWLRISEASGVIYAHTSTNGTSWTQLGTSGVSTSVLDWVPKKVRVGAARSSTIGGGTAGKIMEVDDFNTPANYIEFP